MIVHFKNLILFPLVISLMSGCAQTVSSQNSVDSSASVSSNDSFESSIAQSSDSSSAQSYTSVNNNPDNCQNHQLDETVIKEATLLEKGTKHYHCSNCGADYDEPYYKMDECVFEDMTFMDDGNEHQILIDGVLPYGVSVQYENNSLKGKGQKEATAKFINENNQIFLEKKAKISIIDNVGFANIRVTTEDGEDPDWKTREYKNMTLSVDNCADAYKKTNVPGTMKVRGNSTNQEQVAKRAWRIKFSKKNNLLGLNNDAKEKSWVLLADFFDQSMFRNASAFSMGNALFNYSGNYCSDYQHVNVYMNGDYRGVYLLAEQQQAKTCRIPVNEPDEDVTDTKVGYIVEIDGLVTQGNKIDAQTHIGVSEGDPCFTTGTGSSTGGMWGGWGGWGGQSSSDSINGVNITDKGYVIKTDTYSNDQVVFIKDYMNNALTAFKGVLKGEKHQIIDHDGQLIDSPYTTQYETLNALFDLDSFFRMYVLQEYLKNFDVGWGSFYMWIDFSSNAKVTRLTMGAPWDFDLGEGNKKSDNVNKSDDNFLNNSRYTSGLTTFNPWLYMLSQCDFFETMFKKYYSIFDKSSIYEKMVNYINYEAKAFADEFNQTYTRYGLPNASGATLMQTRQYNTHQEAVSYLLNWYKERKAYLDQTWLKQ